MIWANTSGMYQCIWAYLGSCQLQTTCICQTNTFHLPTDVVHFLSYLVLSFFLKNCNLLFIFFVCFSFNQYILDILNIHYRELVPVLLLLFFPFPLPLTILPFLIYKIFVSIFISTQYNTFEMSQITEHKPTWPK